MFMSIDSFRVRFVFGDRHYTRKGGQCSFYCRFPLKTRFMKDLDTKNKVVFDTTTRYAEEI